MLVVYIYICEIYTHFGVSTEAGIYTFFGVSTTLEDLECRESPFANLGASEQLIC